MARTIGTRHWQNALIVLSGTVVAVVVVSCLYWAQSIFIPLALSVFLTFLLAPIVTLLQRQGVPRVPAALAVMLLTVLLLGGLVWLVAVQVSTLVARLPHYQENIQDKVRIVTDRLEHFHRNLSRVVAPGEEEPEEEALPRPPSVVVKPEAPPWLARIPGYLMPAAHIVGGGALALVLTAFMLIKREDLRNRIIRLAGQRQVTVATRALDEAGQRISRFLIMQALVGAVAGAAIGLGLLALGVEYALLWGFMVFLLRYIPYIGIWFAALPPVLLSLALSDGWIHPLLVAGWIFAVEMVCANMLEPWLYGQSIGVSEVSLLVSAAFFAFLWGPIGMVLSSPMTVCLIVLARYHPRLKFLEVLLGDEPALQPRVRFYQRLLARDQDEAAEVVQGRLGEGAEPAALFDELLVPALIHARRDREADELSEEDEAFILRATREIGIDLADHLGLPPAIPSGLLAALADRDQPERVHVLACPARDEEDEVALRLLASTLDATRWQVEVLADDTLGAELLLQTDEKRPDLILIGSLPPGGMAHTRYLCKRLRQRFPEVKILIAALGSDADEEKIARLRMTGADLIAHSLEETRRHLHSWLPVLAETQSNGEAHTAGAITRRG